MIELEIELVDNRIAQIGFTGEGCAISTASASLLTEFVKGKRLSELINLDRKAMINLIGIEIVPGRIRCLLLPLEALHRALEEKNHEAKKSK